MAICRVKWTLSLLALVACCLIGTVASDKQTLEALALQLKQDNLTFNETHNILQNYEQPEETLEYFTVGELANACEVSLSKCTNEGFRVMSMKIGMYHDSFPRVSEYAKDCMERKVKVYCKEHIDEVAKRFLEAMGEQNNQLIRPILESLKDAGALDEAADLDYSNWVLDEDSIYFERGNEKLYADIIKAYVKAARSELGDSPSAELEEDFLASVGIVFGPYALNYFFMKEISDGNREGPEPDNVLVTDLYKSSRIAAHFMAGVWRKIDREVNGRSKGGNVIATHLHKIAKTATHYTDRVLKRVIEKLNELTHGH